MSTTPEYPAGADRRPADAPVARDAAGLPPTEPVYQPAPVATPVAATTAPAADNRAVIAEERRRRALNRFRGLNLGAAFFGWLVGVGLATLLIAIVAAAGAALSLTQEAVSTSTVTNLSVGGVIILAVILLVSYFAGGYVAGRLSRFSGAIQGVGMWVIGLVVTAGLAIAGVIAGSKYNVTAQLNLPTIPVNGQQFATGGAIALVAMALLTLLAAIAGGTAGLRYHHRVDRALRTPTV